MGGEVGYVALTRVKKPETSGVPPVLFCVTGAQRAHPAYATPHDACTHGQMNHLCPHMLYALTKPSQAKHGQITRMHSLYIQHVLVQLALHCMGPFI